MRKKDKPESFLQKAILYEIFCGYAKICCSDGSLFPKRVLARKAQLFLVPGQQ